MGALPPTPVMKPPSTLRQSVSMGSKAPTFRGQEMSSAIQTSPGGGSAGDEEFTKLLMQLMNDPSMMGESAGSPAPSPVRGMGGSTMSFSPSSPSSQLPSSEFTSKGIGPRPSATALPKSAPGLTALTYGPNGEVRVAPKQQNDEPKTLMQSIMAHWKKIALAITAALAGYVLWKQFQTKEPVVDPIVAETQKLEQTVRDAVKNFKEQDVLFSEVRGAAKPKETDAPPQAMPKFDALMNGIDGERPKVLLVLQTMADEALVKAELGKLSILDLIGLQMASDQVLERKRDELKRHPDVMNPDTIDMTLIKAQLQSALDAKAEGVVSDRVKTYKGENFPEKPGDVTASNANQVVEALAKVTTLLAALNKVQGFNKDTEEKVRKAEFKGLREHFPALAAAGLILTNNTAFADGAAGFMKRVTSQVAQAKDALAPLDKAATEALGSK